MTEDKKQEAAALVAGGEVMDSLPNMSQRRPRVAMTALTDSTVELTRTGSARGTVLGKLAPYDDSLATRRLDPSTVRPSIFTNRIGDSFEGPEFEAFKREILWANGNVQPIKVRRAADGSTWEIVYGHRRHRACAELGIAVLATIHDEMDDLSLFEEMSRENEFRSDLSAYELAMHYKRGIDLRLYKNWAELAAALGKSRAFVSRYKALADLPEFLVQAFPSPNAIRAKWAVVLSQALEADKDAVSAAATDLRGRGLSAKEAFEALRHRASKKLTRVNFTFGSWVESSNRIEINIDAASLPEAQVQQLKFLLEQFDSERSCDSPQRAAPLYRLVPL